MDEQTKPVSQSPLQEGIVFALRKFLEHARVIEAEQKILYHQFDQISTNIKKKRVQKYIDTINI